MDDRHRFRAPPASGIGGKPFPDVFYAFVRKIPMGYGMTHAAVYGDFFIDLSREIVRETLIQSQSPRSLTLYFTDFPARKNGQQSFYALLPVHELTKA